MLKKAKQNYAMLRRKYCIRILVMQNLQYCFNLYSLINHQSHYIAIKFF